MTDLEATLSEYERLAGAISRLEIDAWHEFGISTEPGYGETPLSDKTTRLVAALRGVLQIHQSISVNCLIFGQTEDDYICKYCDVGYPCPTIRAIQSALTESELKKIDVP